MVVMNPAEQLKKARDTERKNELQTLNKVLGLFQLENSTASMGTTTWVYVSLPDASSTCGSWSLPTLLPGYSQYACKPESTYLKLDSTGWIPLNFQSLSSGNPMSNLPIDPKNNSSYYYSYVPTNPYYLAANLEATTTVLALGGGSSPLETYILNDEFTTARSAGAVSGTSAEPTGGTRTVTDTNSKLSIAGSQLSIATGGNYYGDPGVWYGATTRTSGLIYTGQITPQSGTLSVPAFGFDTNTTGNLGSNNIRFYTTDLQARDNLVNPSVGSISYGTTYNLALSLRSTGAYYYIKGGAYTNWTLIWISSSSNTATLYPFIGNDAATTSVFTADNIRIPTSTWLPTPLAYDTFTRGDGAIGNSETTGPDSQTTPSLAWTGGAISSNKNVITPSLGSELVTNGDMELGDPPNNFQATQGVISSVADERTGGGGSRSINLYSTTGSTHYVGTTPSVTLGIGNWATISVWNKRITSADQRFLALSSTTAEVWASSPTLTNTTWAQSTITGRSPTNNYYVRMYNQNVTIDVEGRFDDLSVKPLTLSSLFSSVSTSDADVIADANVTMTAGTQAGLVLNLDSTSSPANFIIVYHDGTSVKVDEAVAGVYTNKQTTTVTYSAGATLRAIREGTKLRVYYNNALVGSELTMTANTNTKHGLFSTYSGNSFDNFTLWARGTGNEYADMPQ